MILIIYKSKYQIKTNFKLNKKNKIEINIKTQDKKEFTKKEFEEFIIKSGAKGSFMIYRSKSKDDELGLEEI